MTKKSKWITLAIVHFSVVALLGFVLRSKILFSLPFIDYNRLLDAHEHFAFQAWATLALMVVMVYEILPEKSQRRRVYPFVFGTVTLISWIQLLCFPFLANNIGSDILNSMFIIVTYLFSWYFMSDLRRSGVSKAVLYLSGSAIASLVFSSAGVLTLAFLFAVKSLNPFLYRDALYTFLHFQYNGFFTFAAFAVFIHLLEKNLLLSTNQKLNTFALLLCFSVWPSLFLSFLWQEPSLVFQILAIAGSVSILLAAGGLLVTFRDLLKSMLGFPTLTRNLLTLSLVAVILKMLLQSLTIFPSIGTAVFGDRPLIIGFLHLVFLAFITLFLFAHFTHSYIPNPLSKRTKLALYSLCLFVVLNELILMVQGLSAMLVMGSTYFPWLLWFTSIGLILSAVLILIATFTKKPERV